MKKSAWLLIGLGVVGVIVLTMALLGAMRLSSHPGDGPMMGAPSSAAQPACRAPSNLPGSTVTVTAADMGPMMGGSAMRLTTTPHQVPAGPVSFVVRNVGWRPHELVILPLATGQAAGQRVPGSDGTVAETGSLGEAAASCTAGRGDGIAPGSLGWTTVPLVAGRYELLCNEPGHYAAGMWAALAVTADGTGAQGPGGGRTFGTSRGTDARVTMTAERSQHTSEVQP